VVGLQERLDFGVRHLAEKNCCWFHGPQYCTEDPSAVNTAPPR
jgi:hypothetical protein